MGMWSHSCSIPYIERSNAQIAGKLGKKSRRDVVCGLLFPEIRLGPPPGNEPLRPQRQTKEFKGDLCQEWCYGNLACWLTRQCEGPWRMRMRTMSTSPRQAARCSGKHPLLSSTFVDASYCSSFSTTSLQQTHINCYFPDQTRKILLKHITKTAQIRGNTSCVTSLDERPVCLPIQARWTAGSSTGNAGKLKDDDQVLCFPSNKLTSISRADKETDNRAWICARNQFRCCSTGPRERSVHQRKSPAEAVVCLSLKR